MDSAARSKAHQLIVGLFTDKVLEQIAELPIGWLPNNLASRLADACVVVLETCETVDDFHTTQQTNFGEE